jgi:chorismate mutase / prephenate dehydratase
VSRSVYYLGPEGTFCHEAALRAFPADSHWVPCPSILAIFEETAVDRERRGVVPVENSIEGGVGLTSEGLLDLPNLLVTGEVVVPVEQCLVSEGTLETIRVVESHPHALPQCKRWLHRYLPNVPQVAVASTALSAQRARGNPERAGISSALGAELAGVPVLARGIQDRAHNATRFLVLGYETPKPTGDDKTSILFSAAHERGALYRSLEAFDQHDINLTRIESRPDPTEMWQYVFFVDLLGHQDDPKVKTALADLGARTQRLRVLGSYPRHSPAG